jgi:hypothetical protein
VKAGLSRTGDACATFANTTLATTQRHILRMGAF